MDKLRNLYSTTLAGGTAPDYSDGTAFELTPTAMPPSTYATLHSFCPSSTNCADGSNPYAGLVMDAS
jgi:hypothetical protein